MLSHVGKRRIENSYVTKPLTPVALLQLAAPVVDLTV